ncbi:putative late blight resistance protein-like protein R1A-3 [Forsythia ovata]|uniref:Late blight resistance protein-like protein R1A-3 n=1 Tax=Forsythia ovata TaxID=205694 RepID=A0ABD1WUI7_9LAMI
MSIKRRGRGMAPSTYNLRRLLEYRSKKERLEHQIHLPGGVTPKTAVVSLFIVDSLLDDLKDLMNHKDDRIVYVKDQMTTILDELMLLRSLLADMEGPAASRA